MRETITTRADAVRYVEERLGADGTRELAEKFCTVTRWQGVADLTEDEWSNVLEDAAGQVATETIKLSRITLDGTDAQGKYAVATIDGERVGVSLRGEDEAVRDLDDIEPGMVVEVGTETMRVVA